MKQVLVDTGPLVAVLSPRDHFHRRCVNALRTLPAPLFTCWPVLTEAAWLLRSKPEVVEGLLRSADSGFLTILPLHAADGVAIARILKRYRDLKPQLADAALLHLAEREGIDTVFTLDQRDFRTYKIGGRKPLNLLPA